MRLKIEKGMLDVVRNIPIDPAAWRTGLYYLKGYLEYGFIYLDGNWYLWKNKEPSLIIYPHLHEDEWNKLLSVSRWYLNDETNEMLSWYKRQLRDKEIKLENYKRKKKCQ